MNQPFFLDPALNSALQANAERIGAALDSPRIAQMYLTQMRDTLERTVNIAEDGTYFVITGDIPAMWLRDSSAQMRPFLHLARQHPSISEMLEGLLRRQFNNINYDPYANAFNIQPNNKAHSSTDLNPDPWLWERKFELDSLAFPVQLLMQYYRATGTLVLNEDIIAAFTGIIDTLELEQEHESSSGYRFVRQTSTPTETLERDGLGSPTGYTGMSWSGFRPSDDACTFHYNVPGNLFAALALDYIAELCAVAIAENRYPEEQLDDVVERAEILAAEIRAGVGEHAVVEHPDFGPIYAYEVDGLGSQLLIDDANMPSLLSLPLNSAASARDEWYQNTREFVLSEANQYYFEGIFASGVGSPHTPHNYVWPIALAVQGLTSDDVREKIEIAELLADTDAGTGMMHEGFDPDNPEKFTREWFSWANSMFCELLHDIAGIATVEG